MNVHTNLGYVTADYIHVRRGLTVKTGSAHVRGKNVTIGGDFHYHTSTGNLIVEGLHLHGNAKIYTDNGGVFLRLKVPVDQLFSSPFSVFPLLF